MAMNKRILVSLVAANFGMSKTRATALIEMIFDALADALKKEGDRATIHRFGIFLVTRRAGRVMKAPPLAGKNRTLKIPDRFSIKFFPASVQKARLNSHRSPP